MNKPPGIAGIVNESTATASAERRLHNLDEHMTRLKKERQYWPTEKSDQLMHHLQRQRQLLEQSRVRAERDQTLFPVAHRQ